MIKNLVFYKITFYNETKILNKWEFYEKFVTKYIFIIIIDNGVDWIPTTVRLNQAKTQRIVVANNDQNLIVDCSRKWLLPTTKRQLVYNSKFCVQKMWYDILLKKKIICRKSGENYWMKETYMYL